MSTALHALFGWKKVGFSNMKAKWLGLGGTVQSQSQNSNLNHLCGRLEVLWLRRRTPNFGLLRQLKLFFEKPLHKPPTNITALPGNDASRCDNVHYNHILLRHDQKYRYDRVRYLTKELLLLLLDVGHLPLQTRHRRQQLAPLPSQLFDISAALRKIILVCIKCNVIKIITVQ